MSTFTDDSEPFTSTSTENSKSGTLRSIRGKSWYPLLLPSKDAVRYHVPALLRDHPIHEILAKKSLVVCLTTLDNSRLYSIFSSYIEFGLYYLKFPPVERCFYEVIFGEAPQKPKFDIDLDLKEVRGIDPDNVVLSTVEAIFKEMEKMKVKLDPQKDLLIFSSCDPSKGEYSYHLVINNYFFPNNLEAKTFYQKVVARLPPTWVSANVVDRSVYSSKQQFRIVGSSKLMKGRYKNLIEGYTNPLTNESIRYQLFDPTLEDEKKLMILLETSLVSQIEHCQPLPSFRYNDEEEGNGEGGKEGKEGRKIKENSSGEDCDEVTPEEAKRALELIANLTGITSDDRKFPYRLGEIKGNLVTLKRIRPSKCRICSRIHEHENPYLLIVGENRKIYLHCRRAPPDRHFLVGSLYTNEERQYSMMLQQLKSIDFSEFSDEDSGSYTTSTKMMEPDDSPSSVMAELLSTATHVKKLKEPMSYILTKNISGMMKEDRTMKKELTRAKNKIKWKVGK